MKLLSGILPAIFFSASLMLLSNNVFTQEIDTVIEEAVYDPSIQSVVFYKSGKINTYPVINLRSPDETLTLAFDDLEAEYREFQYSIIHCNADWKPSRLFYSDYIQGNDYEYIEDYDFSFNTYQDYINYWAVIPSPNMQFKLPGNYILKVYLGDDKNNVVLTRRFYVLDQSVKIVGDVKRPSYAKYAKTKQEVDFEINYEELGVLDPMNDISVSIRQNQRWDNQIEGMKPLYIQGNSLIYNYDEENLFNGYSEWRYVDLRSVKYPGNGVNTIDLDTIYNLFLFLDEDRSYVTYSDWEDVNGNRILASRDKSMKMNELDYVFAHFRLTTPYPKDEDSIYLFGALTDWRIQESFRCEVDSQRNLYTANVLIKQGYYNYYYVRVKNGEIDCNRFQGSHYETENDYHIMVYYRSPMYDADLLVGYQRLNTLE